MPYIRQKDRDGASVHPMYAGELNYAITRCIIDDSLDDIKPLIIGYWHRPDKNGLRPNYQSINDIVGALECAKLEYLRRCGDMALVHVSEALDNAKVGFYHEIAAPYEDVKRETNGDVY